MVFTELFMLFFLFMPSAPYGQPAPAAQVLAHVPPEASLVMALDAASLGQGLDQGLDKLLDNPFIKNTKALAPLRMQLAGGRGALQSQARALGIDPFRDIRFATICLGELDAPTPQLLMSLGGKFPADLAARLAQKGQAKQEGALWVFPKDDLVLTQPQADRLLFGSRPWVELALAGKARNPAMRPLLAGLDKKTYALFAFQPDQALRERMAQTDWLARPLLTSIRGLSFRLGYGGWSIKVVTDDERMRVWQDLFYGLGRYAVATREAIEGTLYLGEAFLASLTPVEELQHGLAGEQEELFEALVAHRAEIHTLLSDLVSGPSPKTKVLVSKKSHSVTLQVDGRGVSALMLAPVMGMALLWRIPAAPPEAAPLSQPPQAPLPPNPPAAPAPPPAE